MEKFNPLENTHSAEVIWGEEEEHTKKQEEHKTGQRTKGNLLGVIKPGKIELSPSNTNGTQGDQSYGLYGHLHSSQVKWPVYDEQKRVGHPCRRRLR